jgi:cell wall-associated NlpC family hydrolase
VFTSAVLGAAALPGGSPRAAAVAVPAALAVPAVPAVSAVSAVSAVHAQGLRPPATGTAESGGNLSTDVDAPAEAPAAATASPVALRTAVHTMSMDAPIQGGLTAHQEQALSARLLSTHQSPAAAPQSEYWTPAMGRSAVARARSWLGMPYSWAGGSASGPTSGRCDPGTGGDLDCHVVGFDCSGLTMYAWGAYVSLPHLAAAQQRDAGIFHPTLEQLLPGDLVFFSGYLPGGTGHVAIYTGHGMVIEAPQSGAVVRRSALADLMAADGYRGAVRPLTGQTPTLTVPRVAVPAAGGTLTLHGGHLANVDAVHLGGVTVRQFVQHSDSAIVFRAPAQDVATVAVTVSTSWGAQSRSMTLNYAQPRPASPSSPTEPQTPPAPGPSTPSPTAPPTPTTSPPTPTTTPPTTAPSTPSPTPSSSPTVSLPPPTAGNAPPG